MGTESHGGDGGLLGDREDGEDDGVTAILREDTEQRAASVPAAGGGRAVQSVEELLQLHPRRREREKCPNGPERVPVPSAVKCPVRGAPRYLKSSCCLSVRRSAGGFKRTSGCSG